MKRTQDIRTAADALRAADGLNPPSPAAATPDAGAGAQPLNGVNRPATRKGRRTRGPADRARKRDPAEQMAMLGRMMRSTARRAVSEDPGVALAGLMALQEQLDALVDQVGAELVAQVGQAAVAADLGWSRQRVYKRWGTRPEGASGLLTPAEAEALMREAM